MTETLKSGRYRIEGTLGSGAQGETLDALDTTTGRRVAVKRFVVRGAASWKNVELAEREARVLASIDHPRLPRYVDHFEENGALCLVMDRMEGESLAALRRRGGSLSRKEVARLLADVGEILDYLHGRAPPLIHRDIKPGNVILRPDGSFALVDFGSVRDSLKPEGGSTVVGTFGYMAPEQFQGRALRQSDVYALGATALTMLTGREPEDLPHRGLGIDLEATLPRDRVFRELLTKMLDPDPDRRASRVTPLVDGAFRGPVPPAHVKPLIPSSLVIVLLLFGLVVARFSTAALFRVFLPVVLALLSIVFGAGLRRAAENMRKVGERGDKGIAHAIDVVRGRPVGQAEGGKARRVRVETSDPEDDELDREVPPSFHRRRKQT